MKKNKLLISLLVVLILSTIVCVTAVATLDTPDTVKTLYKVDKNISDTKEFELPGSSLMEQTEISKYENDKLKYKESVAYTKNKVHDIYIDEKNNEFTYDESGKLIGYKLSNEDSDALKATSQEKLTDKEITDIAYNAACTMYGDIMDEFEFENITHSDYHYVTFVKKYDFVIAAFCFVKVIEDGTIDSCNIVNYNEYSDFDVKLLNGVTKEILGDYVQKQVESDYPEYKLFDIESYSLYKVNEEYYVNMLTNVTIEENNIISDSKTYVTGKDYLYALEK